MSPRNPLGPTGPDSAPLEELLRRLAPRLTALFERHGVPPASAEEVLREAALEVQLRLHRTPDPAARLLSSVECRCRSYGEEIRRQAAGELDRALEDHQEKPSHPTPSQANSSHSTGNP